MTHFRIGLDIDDVLIRTGDHTIKLYNAKYGTDVKVAHWYQFDPPELWGVPNIVEAIDRVRAVTELDEFDDVEPVEGAADVINGLLAAGHEIFAITGRPENVRVQTLRILDRYYPGIFSNQKVFFTDHYGDAATRLSKTEIAQRLRLDYFVDDQVFHTNSLAAADIKTILFSDDYAWNKSGEDESVLRVSSWQEIKEFFDAEQSQ